MYFLFSASMCPSHFSPHETKMFITFLVSSIQFTCSDIWCTLSFTIHWVPRKSWVYLNVKLVSTSLSWTSLQFLNISIIHSVKSSFSFVMVKVTVRSVVSHWSEICSVIPVQSWRLKQIPQREIRVSFWSLFQRFNIFISWSCNVRADTLSQHQFCLSWNHPGLRKQCDEQQHSTTINSSHIQPLKVSIDWRLLKTLLLHVLILLSLSLFRDALPIQSNHNIANHLIRAANMFICHWRGIKYNSSSSGSSRRRWDAGDAGSVDQCWRSPVRWSQLLITWQLSASGAECSDPGQQHQQHCHCCWLHILLLPVSQSWQRSCSPHINMTLSLM